jgi:hypothetical protein
MNDRSRSTIEETMLSLARGVCPSEVARAIAGKDERVWRLLMAPIRAAAVDLALAGVVEIRRKGRPVDPRDFRGIYRIGIASPEATETDGRSDP